MAANLADDLPMSMIVAAFSGIAWFTGLEVSIILFFIFKRWRGLYFWSCALAAWGVLLQPVFVILANYQVWTGSVGPTVMIYLTWMIMVPPQSWMLYSRLHLVLHNRKAISIVRTVLIFTTIVFVVPTIIIGTMAQTVMPSLFASNMIWDRVQYVVFFVQETTLSLIYIYMTYKGLRDRSLLHDRNGNPSRRGSNYPGTTPASAAASSSSSSSGGPREVFQHLIWVNVIVIALDVALLAIQCTGNFYLAGSFKPCVYGIKLKIEFVILNRLIQSVKDRGGHGNHTTSGHQKYGYAVNGGNGNGGANGGGLNTPQPGQAYYRGSHAAAWSVSGGGGAGARRPSGNSAWPLSPVEAATGTPPPGFQEVHEDVQLKTMERKDVHRSRSSDSQTPIFGKQ